MKNMILGQLLLIHTTLLYITKDCDWFVVSLSIGAYKFNNRSASYSGAYLSHNYNSGYFGFGMADIIDVSFKNGTEDDFFYFDARTPQVFAFQKIIDLYDFSMGVAVNGSHHRIEKWNYKAAIEFGYKDQNVGVGYSKYGNVLIYAKASVGIVEVFIALDQELSMGIGLDF